MSKVSKSPQRHTFQKEKYVERCQEQGTEPSEDYLHMWDTFAENDNKKFQEPESTKNNLEYDLLTTDWILDKVRCNEAYAQNLYAALCNNDFTKREVWPILKQEKWHCSWRYAGGIIADMRQEGDYIDWYCSGIRDSGFDDTEEPTELTQEQLAYKAIVNKFVSESVITDEVKNDLYKLGWLCNDNDSE